NQAAIDQGNQMLAMTLVVCAGVGLIQVGLSLALRAGLRPAWSRPSRRASTVAICAGAAAVLIAGIAAGPPGRASAGWPDCTAAENPSNGSARLESFSSNGRWPLWNSALKENANASIAGHGSGSFEVWWAQHGTGGGFVRDAHSLYLETLGELGIIGFA